MAIEYIGALNRPDSIKKYAVIDLEDLCLDKKNPRFSSSTIIGKDREIEEKDIIEYLLRFGNVSELAESINRNHGLYAEEWISCYKNENNEWVVLEGNRRVAACKLLRNSAIVSEEVLANIPIPSVDKRETLSNILRLNAIVYEDAKDAQNYIAAKHTKPEVKKWETVEQCNYYYEQFVSGISPFDIGQRVGEDIKKVNEKIKQFGLFKKVFNVVNEKNPNVLVEEVNILPLVTKFMPPLVSNRGELALSLQYNEKSLSYAEAPGTSHIFNAILLKIGEAFFVRPKYKGNDILEREKSDIYRISTDEIKNKSKVEKLVIEDIRIPGLYNLILKYQEESSDVCVNGKHNAQEAEKEQAPNINSPKSGEKEQSNSNTGSFEEKEEKNSEFFSDLNFDHLRKADYLGIVLVSEELRKISSYNGGNAYKHFPIATSFLLRSLIEQVLSERLKQLGRYETMVKTMKDGSRRTPELGNIIKVFLLDYQNGNLSSFWEDGNLGKEFNKCFSGYGTKDQLDTIIHNPHMLQPDQNFLNSLSKQGLKLVLQGFLEHFQTLQ